MLKNTRKIIRDSLIANERQKIVLVSTLDFLTFRICFTRVVLRGKIKSAFIVQRRRILVILGRLRVSENYAAK
jgi:hypothetical protein